MLQISSESSGLALISIDISNSSALSFTIPSIIFSAKRLESYEYSQIEEMKSLLKSIFYSVGEEILLKDMLSTVSLNLISRMVLGKRYLDESDESNSVVSPDEFKKMLDELFLLNDVFNIGDIPWIDFMDIQGM
ncbi:hypothetical protein L6452_01903 [Arctium lappa]|uniref:Uncharacterized protein n=1 Tax=Arctium lappa TaxID=4217 RepID=A0ACB9FHZ1_ARCLA|nr:hypothetical protein L6452_01903 [Arctium lappa]